MHGNGSPVRRDTATTTPLGRQIVAPAPSLLGHSWDMHSIEHPWLTDLTNGKAGGSCSVCGAPITLDDTFGLSEGICRTCLRTPSVRGLRPAAWLRRLIRAA